MTGISFIIPTRDRPDRLLRTLDALGRLPAVEPCEVVVVDNASDAPPALPARLRNGIDVRPVQLDENLGAAARNIGAESASLRSEWLVMLDDDSHPDPAADWASFLERLRARAPDVAVVTADIHLPARQCRESGGLPEVLIGCGAAVRRRAFLAAGGYDARMGYYAEEYDLCARLLAMGRRVEFDPGFRVLHHKVEEGRDMGLILARLVRNNGWVMQRYAPESVRREMVRDQRRRYRAIAAKEGATPGFGRGLVELRRTIRAQGRTPLPQALWDRFTGLAHAREALTIARREVRDVALVEPGKHCWVVEGALAELSFRLTTADRAEAVVIGAMSPGPMLDGIERWRTRDVRVIAPWLGAQVGAGRAQGGRSAA